MSGDGFAVLAGGCVAILAEGFHGGFVKGWRAGENFHGFDLAGFVDEGVESDVAGHELAERVAGRDGTDGFDEAGRSDGAVVDGGSRVIGIDGFGVREGGVFCNGGERWVGGIVIRRMARVGGGCRGVDQVR